jgi:hypothetical protein
MARQFARRLEADVLRARLPAAASARRAPSDDSADPDERQAADWFKRLRNLWGVPFNYLVPDAAMLPPESIRFFQLDEGWVESLLDGAYSLGFAGVSGPAPQSPAPAPGPCSGFLLRSAVVSGWPGLQALGFADAAGQVPLPVLRRDELAPAVLLYLFAGVLRRVDVQEPSEGMHFGVDAAGPAKWQKQLRYASGDSRHAVGSWIEGGPVGVPMRDRNVVRVAELAAAMAPHVWTDPPPAHARFTSAEFGLEMVEGVQAVRFQLKEGA